MSLRRHFVPTAWLLCGLPLSLSFRMNATLACNATQSRKLKVPNLNSAALCSEMEPRSESRNASLARTAPSVEMSQVGHHGGPQQKANWQKPAGKTTARACPAPVPPAFPPSQWAALIPYRKVTKRTKRKTPYVWQQLIQVPSHTHGSKAQGVILRGSNGITPGRMSRARGREGGARSAKMGSRGKPVAPHS